MTHFEFLMGLVGFVGAIAISSVLVFWGSVAQRPNDFERPWFLLAITIGLVLNLIIHIGGIWGYRDVAFDMYYKVVILLLPVVFLTLSVTTFIPSTKTTSQNLEAHYFTSARYGYSFLAITFVVSVLIDELPGVVSLDMSWWLVGVSAFVVALPGYFSSRILHATVLLLYYVVTLIPLLLAPIL